MYELRLAAGKPQQLEATTATELAAHLAKVARLDPYGSRAAAHVLHVLRGRIEAPGFSARRLGIMAFQPDGQDAQGGDAVAAAPPARPPQQPVHEAQELASQELLTT